MAASKPENDYVHRVVAGLEELHGKVFGENNTPGLLNVYIHYLREKIEGEDEKIILSSRKQGYKINERYI